jgi:hypothetical protein
VTGQLNKHDVNYFVDPCWNLIEIGKKTLIGFVIGFNAG